MIVFDGRSGGLGRYFAAALDADGVGGRALASRLEDRNTTAELGSLELRDERVCLVQLAAKASVAECERDPESARQINVEGVVARVEQFVRFVHERKRAAAVVYVSTGHVYATKSPGSRCKEGDAVAPRSVYASTKAEAEERLTAYCERSGAELVIARVFGLVAPAQPAAYVLPSLIARVRADDVSRVPGAECVRDYLDARDVSRILLALASHAPKSPLIVNVCSGKPVSIRQLLELVIRQVHGERALELLATIGSVPGRPDDVPWLVGDPSRLSQIVARPRTIDLARTVADAIEATR